MIIFPQEIDFKPELKKYENQKTKGLKKALEDPKSVTWLTLQGGLMSEIGALTIPQEIEQLTELEVLEINYYNSIEWTDILAKLPKLHTLLVIGNEFRPAGIKLGAELAQIPNLHTLSFDIFFPLEIDEAFSRCQKLKHLWIEECDLRGIEQVSKLAEIEELSLDIEDKEDLSCLTKLGKLTRFRLGIREQVPDWIKELRLKTLALLSYRVKILPDWLGQMHSLEELDITQSDISELPEGFPNLNRLEIINTPLAEKTEHLKSRFPDVEIIDKI
jgi:Leucine-rich repeat (LRR) protein